MFFSDQKKNTKRYFNFFAPRNITVIFFFPNLKAHIHCGRALPATPTGGYCRATQREREGGRETFFFGGKPSRNSSLLRRFACLFAGFVAIPNGVLGARALRPFRLLQPRRFCCSVSGVLFFAVPESSEDPVQDSGDGSSELSAEVVGSVFFAGVQPGPYELKVRAWIPLFSVRLMDVCM